MNPRGKDRGFQMKDKQIERLIARETERQNRGIELIASENYPSHDVMAACGSIMMAKYAEGYPGKRYYGGCEVVDEMEVVAIERAKKLFHCAFANVQPHSGSQANFAAYRALLQPGDKVLSLALNDGGHLTHGSPVSFSSQDYQFVHYDLGEDGKLDYELIKRRLEEERPRLLLAGYSAYPFAIDFKKLREIVDEFNSHSEIPCLFMVDMAHIAGIVAARLCQNPCDYADVVTSTTHKTLRGPRGGLILTNREDLAKKIDFAVFPYSQGGPLEHIIAGKAVCFLEDLQPEFKTYMEAVLANTKACCGELIRLGCQCSGTENHLFLLNVLASFGITGKEGQARLEEIGITANKNMIHGDKLPAFKTSGLRFGFAAATTRGCTLEDAKEIAHIIYDALKDDKADKKALSERTAAIVSSWKSITEIEAPLSE